LSSGRFRVVIVSSEESSSKYHFTRRLFRGQQLAVSI
jgi:hypothetical protein